MDYEMSRMFGTEVKENQLGYQKTPPLDRPSALRANGAKIATALSLDNHSNNNLIPI